MRRHAHNNYYNDSKNASPNYDTDKFGNAKKFQDFQITVTNSNRSRRTVQSAANDSNHQRIASLNKSSRTTVQNVDNSRFEYCMPHFLTNRDGKKENIVTTLPTTRRPHAANVPAHPERQNALSALQSFSFKSAVAGSGVKESKVTSAVIDSRSSLPGSATAVVATSGDSAISAALPPYCFASGRLFVADNQLEDVDGDFTKFECLSDADKTAYTAEKFHLGSLPKLPPSRNYCR